MQAHLDGRESDADRATLERFRQDWVRVLYRLLDRADRVIEETRRIDTSQPSAALRGTRRLSASPGCSRFNSG